MPTEDDKKSSKGSSKPGVPPTSYNSYSSYSSNDSSGNFITAQEIEDQRIKLAAKHGRSTNKKSSSSDASDMESRRERHRRRADEERRSKAKAGDTKEGRRAKPAPSGKRDTAKRSKPRAATPGAVQQREDNGRTSKERNKAKRERKDNSTHEALLSASPEELRARAEQRKQRSQRHRDGKKNDAKQRRPGASLNDRDGNDDAITSNSQGVVAAVTVDENNENKELKKKMKRQKKKMEQQMEQERQGFALQNEAAAEQQRRQEEERAQELEEEKRKKKRCFIWAFVGAVAIAAIATVVTLLLVGKDDTVAPSPTATTVDQKPSDGNFVFDPPSKEICQAIATASGSFQGDFLDQKQIGMIIELVFQNDNDIVPLLPSVAELLRENFLTYLAGCVRTDSFTLRKRRRYLKTFEYIVSYGEVSGILLLDDECTVTPASGEFCKRISVILNLDLKDTATCDEMVDHVRNSLTSFSGALENLLLEVPGFKYLGGFSVDTCETVTGMPTTGMYFT